MVKKILKHCDLWDDSSPPSLNSQVLAEAEQEFVEEVTIDLDYFDMIAWISKATAGAISLGSIFCSILPHVLNFRHKCSVVHIISSPNCIFDLRFWVLEHSLWALFCSRFWKSKVLSVMLEHLQNGVLNRMLHHNFLQSYWVNL